MLSKVLRIAGGVILTLAIVWALVFGWWHSNDHHPDTGELALYLVALPLALIGGYWLLRLSIDQIKAKPQAEAAAQPAASEDPLALARAKTDAAERAYSLRVTDTFIVAAGGAKAEEILAAVEADKQPQPVPELIDKNGRPVFAAVVAGIDATVTDAITERHPNLKKLLQRDDAPRALELLDRVLQQACEAIRTRLAGLQPPGKLRLQLLCLLPAAWGNSDFPHLQSWLRAFDWPPSEALELDIQLVPVASDVDALRQVDQAILHTNREAGNDRLLILVAGAMSAATQSGVAEYETTTGLFAWEHQDRLIPGEGAVAILFAPEAVCTRLKLTDCVAVSRVSHAVRDKSVHAGGRVRGVLIEELLAGLLSASGVAAQDITAAVLDTDRRPIHAAEIMEGLGTAFAHLEPVKDFPATGRVNGYLTPLGGLIALACACHRAQANQSPVLCISNQHDRERAALLVRPANFDSSSETRSTT